jgi:2-keto-3-deoxy-L-rhamnonate aldolase RhmA
VSTRSSSDRRIWAATWGSGPNSTLDALWDGCFRASARIRGGGQGGGRLALDRHRAEQMVAAGATFLGVGSDAGLLTSALAHARGAA